ncbi:MAG: P-loop NTPase [candidate division KSB1 bacterium]|nr:P-loop NTPase [candidate division KSB1 bacterium]
MDQAQTLRELVNRTPALHLKLEAEKETPEALTLVITSGKGGVGKTVLAGNLAAAFAAMGRRTLLVDGDLLFPNQDLVFGLRPRLTMLEAVEARLPMDKACVPVAPNLWLLPSRAVEAQYLGLETELLRRLIHFLEFSSGYEVRVVDTASGLSGKSLDLATVASELWIVTTPSAPSIADSYAMIKHIWTLGLPVQLGLCINGAKSEDQARDLHARFNHVTRRFLGREIPLVGWVPQDPRVEESLESGRPLALEHPRSGLAKAVSRMAREAARRLALASGRER